LLSGFEIVVKLTGYKWSFML